MSASSYEREVVREADTKDRAELRNPPPKKANYRILGPAEPRRVVFVWLLERLQHKRSVFGFASNPLLAALIPEFALTPRDVDSAKRSRDCLRS